MRHTTAAGLAVLLLLAPALGAFADKKEKKKSKGAEPADVAVSVSFRAEDRRVVETYFVEKHGRGNCPPGLAKKNNGCLPPGQAKKRYVVGQPLAREIVIVEPPPELVVRIGPPPSGYRYAMVDGDLVKLAIGTALVVDAIHGLVH